jgi:hypothetical protein
MTYKNMTREGRKLKCGCYFTKGGFFDIAPECQIHIKNLEEGEPFYGVEK